MDFFDNAFTNSKNRSNVTCCHLDTNTFEVANCGQGASCAGACSALDASLCPSGNCAGYPETCEIKFRSEDTEDEQSGGSTATLSGSDLKWCTGDGCRVVKHPECCYNPNCLTWTGRAKECGWLDYLTGMNNAIQDGGSTAPAKQLIPHRTKDFLGTLKRLKRFQNRG